MQALEGVHALLERIERRLAELLKMAAAAPTKTPPANNPSPSPGEELPRAA